MSGFFTSTTAMRIYKVSETVKDFEQKLDAASFLAQPKDVPPQEKIVGFVGLGDPLDTEFLFGVRHEQYLAVSLRIDERKPSMPAVRLRLAEAIKKEAENNNGKVSRERKKELKEETLLQVTAKSDYVPTLVDCIMDTERSRLIISTLSETQAILATELFSRVFGVSLEALTPEEEMPVLFRTIYTGEEAISFPVEDDSTATIVSDDYAVTLQTPEDASERASVSARGNQEAGLKALEQGLYIRRMGILAEIRDNAMPAEDPKVTCSFSLDDGLFVSGLKMPKHERGNEREDDFFLKAGHAFLVADIVEKMSASK